MEYFRQTMEVLGAAVDAVGVVIVVVGAAVATARFARSDWNNESYRSYRHSLGRAILLGLEFLGAGDIIRTVVVSPTFENVAVLGLIVVIRTFLSIALEVELNGRLPWQQPPGSQSSDTSKPTVSGTA